MTAYQYSQSFEMSFCNFEASSGNDNRIPKINKKSKLMQKCIIVVTALQGISKKMSTVGNLILSQSVSSHEVIAKSEWMGLSFQKIGFSRDLQYRSFVT